MKTLLVFVLAILSDILVADVKAQCDDGWSYWQRDNKCIKAFDKKGLTWKDAMYQCLLEKGRLVNIHDKATTDFVNDLVKDKKSYYWIGLADFKNGNIFKWVDGTTLSGYTNWGANQPDSYGGTEDCVHLRDDFQWNDIYCTATMNKYICEKRGPGCQYNNGGCPNECHEENTSIWKASCSKRCDDGWAEVNGICYDIDECSINNGGCAELCRNDEGTFGCTCHIGYEYDGNKCVLAGDLN